MFYYLKHRDDIIAVMSIEEETGAVVKAEIIPGNSRWLPFLGKADRKLLSIWIRNRSIPATREQIAQILHDAGCRTAPEYLFKNLALSVTDAYWMVPVDYDLQWADVSPFHSMPGKKMPLHNDSSWSPNASLGGQMSKYVDLTADPPLLVKRSKAFYGLQCLNEVIASRTHARQGKAPYVSYDAHYDEEKDFFSCSCTLFTRGSIEFVPAYEVLLSEKQPNDCSNYDFFIRICEKNGLSGVRAFMDYMTLSDFALTNTDRHLYNFGVIRDAQSGAFISPAPIFDTGNSMFYNQIHTRPMRRDELLDIPISAFHTREEKMLQHVNNREAFDIRLALTPDEVLAYYLASRVPKDVAETITEDYAMKLRMLEEYQEGHKLSFYMEKKKLK